MGISTSDIRDLSLRDSLRTALKDGRISYGETVNLIRDAFDYEGLTNDEKADLRRIADRSTTMDARSKQLIRTFLNLWGGRWIDRAGGEKHMKYFLALARGVRCTPNVAADRLITRFMARSGPRAFPKIARRTVGLGLLVNTRMPGLIAQGPSSLCGPSALLFNLARDNAPAYCQFAIDLFEKGKAQLGKLEIEAGTDLKAYDPPNDKIAPVDWMTAASIRDSENWFFDYQSVDDKFAGITMPNEMATWFTNLGYTKVENNTNLIVDKDVANAKKADSYYRRGFRVCLFICGKMLQSDKQTNGSVCADHWVGLNSRMVLNTDSVLFDVFTWGHGHWHVPQGSRLSLEDFLNNYYGFVAAKF